MARPDYSDDLMLTFVRSAESYLNREMRVKEMVTVVATEIVDINGAFDLPDDYNELKYIRPVDGKPLDFVPDHTFFGAENTTGGYTIVGTKLYVGGTIDASDLPEMNYAYFANIPAFSSAATWLYTKYYDIYLQATNAAGLFYGQEFERSTALTELVLSWVASANGNSKTAMMSGSPLVRPRGRKIG